MTLPGQVAQVPPVLAELSPTEQRLLASAVLVIGAVLFGALLVPLLVREVRRLFAQRYLGGQLSGLAERINERFPLTTPVRLALRMLQVTVVTATVVGLLVVWREVGTVEQLLQMVAVEPIIVARATATFLLLLGGYVGMGLLEDAIEALTDSTDRMTAHQEQIITHVSQVTLLVFVGLIALSVWDVSLQGLLVGAGFLGIVIGFAARQTLGSLIAGFVLMFSRPFEIGDWVEVGEEQGVVTDITIINTRLETFDGEFVVIPNDRVADSAVTNRSQKGRLRLRIEVGVDYDSDPERAARIAEEAIGTIDEITPTPPPDVFPKTFGDSAVVLEVRFWIEHPTPPKRWRAQAAVVREIKTAFEREGIKIPYPQRELSGREETGGFQVAGAESPVPDPEPYSDGSGE